MRSKSTKKLLAYIGANVQRLRKRRIWTQEKLAEKAELDLRYLQRVERGSVNLSIDVLSALADALDTTPVALLRAAKVNQIGRAHV